MTTLPFFIAVGVDGGDDSDHAVHWAAGWAHSLGADLRIVSADRGTDQKAVLARLDEVAARARDLALAAHPDLTVETDTSVENPVTAMLDESDTAAALVIGTRGTGGWRGTGVGSVAGSVASAAKCPTMVVTPGAARDYDPTGDMVIGFDGSQTVSVAAKLAVATAAQQNRTVRLVHSTPDQDAVLAVEAEAARLREYRPGVTVDVVAEDLPAAELLTRETATGGVLIMATRGHRGVPGFLPGPTTLALLQHSRTPVLVLSETNERHAPKAR